MTACPTCSEPVSATPAAEQAVATGPLTVRVTGLVVATCPGGHRHVLPHDAAARTAAGVRQALLAARAGGLLRRRDRCGDCGADLVLPPRHTDTPVPIELDGHVLTVVVEAPMARCPDCGREQLPPDVMTGVAPALQAAVRAAADG